MSISPDILPVFTTQIHKQANYLVITYVISFNLKLDDIGWQEIKGIRQTCRAIGRFLIQKWQEIRESRRKWLLVVVTSQAKSL